MTHRVKAQAPTLIEEKTMINDLQLQRGPTAVLLGRWQNFYIELLLCMRLTEVYFFRLGPNLWKRY